MTLDKNNLCEEKNLFVFCTYARENIVGDENTLDRVSCKPTIKSSCGSLFNKSARSATEAMRKHLDKKKEIYLIQTIEEIRTVRIDCVTIN